MKITQYRLCYKMILFSLVICLFANDMYAQKLTDTIALPEVKILGKRKIEEAGLHVTHVDTLELKTMKTLTISELLSSYSPIFIKSYGRGSTATASFRGTAPSHTQLYWNGLKLNSPMRGDVDFSLFPVYFIDDISLLYGGSSIESGTGALGGSVLVDNKPDWKDQLSLRYIQTVESFSTKKEYLNLGFGNGRIQFKNLIFTNCWSYDNKILIINSYNDQLIDSIEVLKQPNSMVIDRDNKIWVLSDGGFEGSPFGNEQAGLLEIDAETYEIERTFRFNNNDRPLNLCINPSGDTLYFLNKHIWKMAVSEKRLPEKPFILSPYAGLYGGFYSLAIDPGNKDIYVGDAIDHRQNGFTYRYNNSGKLIDSFKVGISPGDFAFKTE